MNNLINQNNSNEPLISIVIPTKNSDKSLENCLKSIKSQSYLNIEIIIVDGNSIDNTRNIACQFNVKLINKAVRRARARNIGIRLAKGVYILSLDSDMQLTSSVIEDCVQKIKNYDALIIPEESFGIGFWSKCKKLEKCCLMGDVYSEAARFFRKDILDVLSGYDENLEAGEDWDLNARIKNFGYSIGRIYSYINHYEGKLTLNQAIRKKYFYGKTIHAYIRKHNELSKVQLFPIKYAYIKNCKHIFRDPKIGLGFIMLKTLESIAGFAGYIQSLL